MSQEDVIELLNLFERNGIEVIVDGGWGVDALVGEQTRSHEDLDIATEHKNVPFLRKLLKKEGYEEIPRGDSTDYMFIMADKAGHKVDVHSYTFDAKGNNIYGIEYPLESLSGAGLIGSRTVKCIAAESVLKFHQNYAIDNDNYHDVKVICEKLNLPLPEEYKNFENRVK